MKGENTYTSGQSNDSFQSKAIEGTSECKKCLHILYYNARSILSKCDELHAIIVQMKQPHILCIVQTWLSPDITDNELQLPCYQLVRLDRNRHGGSVLLYVHNMISCKVLIKGGPFKLEFLAFSVTLPFVFLTFVYVSFIVLLLPLSEFLMIF